MRNWLQNLELQKKIILLSLTAVVVLFVGESLSRKNSHDLFRQKILEKDVQILNIYGTYLDAVFNEMENTVYSMVGDEELLEKLSFIQVFPREQGYSASLKRAHELIRTYYLKHSYLRCMIVSTDKYMFRYGSPGDGIQKKLVAYMDMAAGKNGRTQMISEEGFIVLVKEIRQFTASKIERLGYIIAWVDFDEVMRSVRNKLPGNSADFDLSIYDGDICLYSSLSAEPLKGAEAGWYVDGEDLVTIHTLPELGYNMIIRTFYGEVQSQIRQTYIRSVLISLLVSAVLIILSIFVAKHVVKDLKYLLHKMDDFGGGKLPDKSEVQKYQGRKDEIAVLNRHFYQMTYNYKRLVDEYYESESLRKEIEFNYLQKQIQPHLLYNTLSAVSWMAYDNQDIETAQMVDVMGRMMRMITDDQEPMISVAQELKIVEDYVTIQKLRFGNRLKVDISVSDRTKRLRIPKITLQPLVENSIIYGMDQMVSQCEINIFERRDGDAVELIVEDNGTGFAEDVLEKTEKEGEKQNDKKGTGIALRNIQIRLMHAFSEKYGLRFKRLEDGMQVIVRIPDQEEI